MKGNLRTHLKDKLEPNELELLFAYYDIVGDIAVIRVPETLKLRIQTIVEALLKTQKHVKTVLRQISPVAGDFRLRDLEWIAGEKKRDNPLFCVIIKREVLVNRVKKQGFSFLGKKKKKKEEGGWGGRKRVFPP